MDGSRCAWCQAEFPYGNQPWIVVDLEDGLMGMEPLRYCSPLHASFALRSMTDGVNSPEQTVQDLQALQFILDYFASRK